MARPQHRNPDPRLPPAPSLLRRMTCGVCMGVADAVPGVSGGTIALILGVYRHLIAHLAAVVDIAAQPWLRGPWLQLPTLLRFLVPLLLPLLIALWLTTRLLVGVVPDVQGLDVEQGNALLRENAGWLIAPHTAPLILGFFFGLVAASLTVPWRARHNPTVSPRHIILVILGAVAAMSLTLMPASSGSVHPLALALAGAAAIAVMLLPGISGSLLLLVLGMYQPISDALHRGDVGQMTAVAIGVGLGVALVIPLLRRLLQRAHDATMATLTGLMAGSLLALWPWKQHYLPQQVESWGPMYPILPHGSWLWVGVAAALGAGIMVLVRLLAPPPQHGEA